jgi:midasin
MADAAVSDTVASVAAKTLTTSTTKSAWPELEPKSFAVSDESMIETAALFTSSSTTATFDASLLRDPLKINLKRQIKKLIDIIVIQRSGIESQLPTALEVFNSFAYGVGVVVERKDLLDVVSRCLSVPQLLESVVDLFRPLLIDLFARWLDDENIDGEVKEERLVVLAYVVEVYEEIFPSVFSLFPFLYFGLLITEFVGSCTNF